MADTRHQLTLGIRFRFLLRVAGATGVLAVVTGAALFASAFPSPAQWSADQLRAAAGGHHGAFAKAAAWTLAVGLIAVAAALAVEVLAGLVMVAGRRSAASTSATVGALAALALLAFVNAYSFTHHARFDFTRTRQFTLPPDLAASLRSLRPESPTTIVVLQKHRIFGSLSDDRDSFTRGAEEKVAEKVKDLVDLFREFGPRFNVEVLDTEAFGYRARVAELTAGAPELKAAIEAAPENSILFHANKRVQRLAFNEFLQLDKTASDDANGGRGNLVLLPQGVDNFARRVLAVQERRPKVAVCVVHEWLTTVDTAGRSEYSLAGLKKSLTDSGFDVTDIILKKNWESGQEPDPAAYTIQESKLERLEAELDSARDQHRAAQNDVKIVASLLKAFDDVQTEPFRERGDFYVNLSRAAQIRGWTEVVQAYRSWLGEEGRPISEANEPELRPVLLAGITRQAARAERDVKDADKARAEAEEQVRAAHQDERTVQDRRIADVKAKFSALLSDVDLLVIPRHTVVNAVIERRLPPALHTLGKDQLAVIKDFMKAGKPVLACLGSLSVANGPAPDGTDDLERLVAERGIELGRDTVLFDAETKGFAAIKAGRQLGGGPADIPPLVVVEVGPDARNAKPNPVGSALRLTGRAVDQKLENRLGAPRPVYLTPGWQDRLPHAAEFVFTAPDAWNEERPFIRGDARGRPTYTPRYEPTLDTEPKWGTRQAERKGPFPVGVAVESRVPAAWFDDGYDTGSAAAGVLLPLDGVLAAGLTAAATKLERPTQRLVVFGSGHLFTGAKLEPAQEKLLVHSVNWLTGRTDRLPHADLPPWEFPRVAMTDREFHLWRYGTAIGLPLVAAYLGLMATMLRRMR
ncbi:unnamed protein product [Gemmataceae bacterium]|nr:unnamed protein product [Gemmataceae bacterium]VTT98335.1 unnamed protein product [Gemmataceae bacterium]